MKIYTKTGDKGETGVIGGRIKKNSPLINTIGTIDELNANISIVQSYINTKEIAIIQNLLFYIGSFLSGAELTISFKDFTKIIENSIDSMENELEDLTQFIIPGGSIESAQIHLSRAVCRRAEREFINFVDSITEKDTYRFDKRKLPEIQIFLNRLSDYLFVLARFTNKSNNIQDSFWNKKIK